MRKQFELAAKKCFQLNDNLPQELELHFALDLMLVPQVVLASHLLDCSLVTNMLLLPSVDTIVESELNIWELFYSRESMNSVGRMPQT